jgi:membrane protease YdiL (CAAX protease family)
LFVSFGHSIVTSTYYVMGGAPPADSPHQQRLISALLVEVGSLSVLWYVLSGQSRSWKSIGWNLKWTDIPSGVGLLLGSLLAAYTILIPIQVLMHAYSGHYLRPKSLHGFFGFGISGLSIAFVCLNPFFEELIVRGYLMTEIIDLCGNGALAVLISIAVQVSYHTYQGLLHAMAITAIFTVSSIYFWRSRRIAPIVLAHLCIDAYALFRGTF